MSNEGAGGDGQIRPGIRIGRYEILSALGAGGMGEVWRARDTTLQRDVAVKALPASMARDGDRLQRLQREAQVLARLNHPNIAVIHGLETWGSTAVIVLELVEGLTLADRLARGPIAPDNAVAMALQLAETIEAAHEQGVVHRDLKPANIKITPDGRIKVLDFGIAKVLDPQTRQDVQRSTISLENSGVSGTAAYMSPEQARGEAITAQTDIWAFGVVLFEMLSSVRPFRAETTVDVLAQIIGHDPD